MSYLINSLNVVLSIMIPSPTILLSISSWLDATAVAEVIALAVNTPLAGLGEGATIRFIIKTTVRVIFLLFGRGPRVLPSPRRTSSWQLGFHLLVHHEHCLQGSG